MSRPIKFRAWHKKLKVLKDIFAINFTEEYQTVGIHLDNPTWHFKDIELMQFTGLLDKNGKEIYEGDICRWGGGVGKENIGSPIVFEFHKYFFGIRCYGKDVDDICEKCGKETGQKKHILEKSDNVYLPDSFDGEERCNGFEVIGNIYENSELLK